MSNLKIKIEMKKVKIIFGMLLLTSLCSCSRQLYKVGHVYRLGDSRQEAEYRAGGHDISSRHERNSGALVTKSQYTQTVFEVNTGWLVAKSTFTDVYVTFGGNTTVISKSDYGAKHEWPATVGGKKKVFVVEVTRTATYGRLLENGLIVGRYTF